LLVGLALCRARTRLLLAAFLRRRGITCQVSVVLPGLLLGSICTGSLFAATIPTTTTLTVSPGTVRTQVPVTLTATVAASGAPVNPGQVVFCNASANYCEDLAILGTAQLTSNGTASIKRLLGLGRHNIYAKFKGTKTYSPSTSLPAIQTVEVTGHEHSKAAISKYGNAGDYTLVARQNSDLLLNHANEPVSSEPCFRGILL
jgi:hypothetical protein